MRHLIQKTEYLVDLHGSLNEGKTTKYIVEDDDFESVDPYKYYDDDMNEVDTETTYPQDGHSLTIFQFKIREVSEGEAVQIIITIDDYDKI